MYCEIKNYLTGFDEISVADDLDLNKKWDCVRYWEGFKGGFKV